MRDDELDRILSAETGIVPSSGFTVRVMDAVRRQAAPPPLPFPWKRALPGLAACIALVILVALSGDQSAGLPLPDFSRAVSAANAALVSALKTGVGWAALALLLTFASVFLSLRLTRGNS